MDLNALMHSENAANIQVVISAKDLRDCFESWLKFATQKIKERDEPTYYTREELEGLLHITPPTLIKYRKEGRVPEPMLVGGKLLYDKAEVHRKIEEGKLKIKIKRS